MIFYSQSLAAITLFATTNERLFNALSNWRSLNNDALTTIWPRLTFDRCHC